MERIALEINSWSGRWILSLRLRSFYNVYGSVGLASDKCALGQPDDIPIIVKLNDRIRKSGEGRVCLNLQLHATGRKLG